MNDNYLIKTTHSELDGCNFSKTVLMCLVVFCHAIDFWTGTWFTRNPVKESEFLGLLAEFIGSFHIYCFVLISGYIFRFLTVEKKRYPSFKMFIRNKALRFLVPYIFVCFVWIAPIMCLFFDYTPMQFVMNFALALSPGQLWFLWMLFFVFLISYLLVNTFEKSTVIGAVICLFFYVVGATATHIIPNFFQIWTACQYVTFFWIGFKIRQNGFQRLMKVPSLIWILVDIALFLIVQFLSFEDIVFRLIRLGLSYLLNIIGALMAFVVLQNIAQKTHWSERRFWKLLSERSMTVYLFHQQVIYLTISLLNGKLNPYLHSAVNFITALVVSLIISSILFKYKWTRFLIGEK